MAIRPTESARSIWLCGVGLALILATDHAATEQSRDEDFDRAKVNYIRRYAWPKRIAQKPDQLFEKKSSASGSPTASINGDGKAATSPSATGSSTDKPLPPPNGSEPSEGQQNN